MSTVLHLDSSARRTASVSRELSRFFVDAWTAAHPDDEVVYRDLAREQLPLVSDEWVAAAFTPGGTKDAAGRFALNRSDSLIDELLAADLLVVGAPVYNFNVPAALKAWIDLVARVGRTFVYGADGAPVGLVEGKRVVVTASSGTPPDMLAGMGLDHHGSYLRSFFGFLGVTDVTIVSAWGRDAETVGRTTADAHETLLALLHPAQPPAPRSAATPRAAVV